MLPIFPASFFDELFGSRVSRSHRLLGYKSQTTTFKELFDSAPFAFNLWVPPRLEILVKKLPGKPFETMKAILQENTLFPLFQTFCGCRIIAPSAPNSDDFSLSAVPRRIVGETGTTYMCPECVKEDFETVGMPYIHRSHQIPGVLVCYKHGDLLLDRCNYCGCSFERKRELFTVPWQNCVCDHPVQSMSSPTEIDGIEKAVSYAKFCHKLLQTSGEELDAKLLTETLRNKIMDMGFRRKNSIARTEFFAAVEEFYGKDLLTQMDAAYRNGRISGWLNHILGSTTSDAPLNRYLIIAYFVFKETGNYWSEVESTKTQVNKVGSTHKVRGPGKKRKSSKRTNRIVSKSNGDKNNKVNQIVSELQCIYEEHPEYDLNDFWSNCFGLMKRLVVTSQDEFDKFRVAVESGKSFGKDAGKKGRRKNIDKYRKLDIEASGDIERIAIAFYASEEKPVKVTKGAGEN